MSVCVRSSGSEYRLTIFSKAAVSSLWPWTVPSKISRLCLVPSVSRHTGLRLSCLVASTYEAALDAELLCGSNSDFGTMLSWVVPDMLLSPLLKLVLGLHFPWLDRNTRCSAAGLISCRLRSLEDVQPVRQAVMFDIACSDSPTNALVELLGASGVVPHRRVPCCQLCCCNSRLLHSTPLPVGLLFPDVCRTLPFWTNQGVIA